jgi:hypothetical protein
MASERKLFLDYFLGYFTGRHTDAPELSILNLMRFERLLTMDMLQDF